jgi:hypothetical protein
LVTRRRAPRRSPSLFKADAQWAKEAIQTLGPSYNLSNYPFIGGTDDLEGGIDDDVLDGGVGYDVIRFPGQLGCYEPNPCPTGNPSRPYIRHWTPSVPY